MSVQAHLKTILVTAAPSQLAPLPCLAGLETGCSREAIYEAPFRGSCITQKITTTLVNFLRPLLAALSLMSAIQGAAIAQDLPKGQKATPATQADIITYKNMGAYNSCILMTKLDQPAAKAVEVSAAMMSSVLLQKHGGIVPEDTSAKSPQQLTRGSAIYIILAIKEICFNQLNKANQEFIATNAASIESLTKKNEKK
jgi:hypothetical protein